jgi:hypothetical protein
MCLTGMSAEPGQRRARSISTVPHPQNSPGQDPFPRKGLKPGRPTPREGGRFTKTRPQDTGVSRPSHLVRKDVRPMPLSLCHSAHDIPTQDLRRAVTHETFEVLSIQKNPTDIYRDRAPELGERPRLVSHDSPTPAHASIVKRLHWLNQHLRIHHRDIWHSTEDAFGGLCCFIDNAFGISDGFP